VGILSWVVLGAVAAWLEQRVLPSGPRSSFVGSMVLAFAGAMLGNLVAYALGFAELSGLTLRSILISAAGVTTILVAYRLIRAVGASSKSPPAAT
jgi:uncharacterized membrane protein YeaQ/YmgE (transglycosylase-associated protein family)